MKQYIICGTIGAVLGSVSYSIINNLLDDLHQYYGNQGNSSSCNKYQQYINSGIFIGLGVGIYEAYSNKSLQFHLLF